ncbi:MAG: PqqD family protein [Candidatus Sulfotelmatobacter sp.]
MSTTLLRKAEFVKDQCGPHLEQVFVRSQAVVSRRVAGETLIVPVRGKVGDLASIYSFNETGSLIWQSMESPKGLAELISAVQQEYAVGYEQAERDVKQFLNDTLSAGLVEVRKEVCQQVSMPAMDSTERGELQSAGSH